MAFTVILGHLRNLPDIKVGHTFRNGDYLGTMGSTGASNAPHLHLGVACGEHSEIFHLKELEHKIKPSAKQSLLFVDLELFSYPYKVTTPYACPEYYKSWGKVHYGYDLVPVDRHDTDEHFDIFWNRSSDGRVTKLGHDPGYGYYMMVTYKI